MAEDGIVSDISSAETQNAINAIAGMSVKNMLQIVRRVRRDSTAAAPSAGRDRGTSRKSRRIRDTVT